MKQYTDLCFKKLDVLVDRVELEHLEQIKKWGIEKHTAFEWLAYVSEEVGELSQAISEYEYRDGRATEVMHEAIQVATLVLKIAEMFHGEILKNMIEKAKKLKLK